MFYFIIQEFACLNGTYFSTYGLWELAVFIIFKVQISWWTMFDFGLDFLIKTRIIQFFLIEKGRKEIEDKEGKKRIN